MVTGSVRILLYVELVLFCYDIILRVRPKPLLN